METQSKRGLKARTGRRSTTGSPPETIESSLAAVEGRVRDSLAGAQAEAKERGRRLARYMAEHPVGCFLVAFLAGLSAARLLRRLD